MLLLGKPDPFPLPRSRLREYHRVKQLRREISIAKKQIESMEEELKKLMDDNAFSGI